MNQLRFARRLTKIFKRKNSKKLLGTIPRENMRTIGDPTSPRPVFNFESLNADQI